MKFPPMRECGGHGEVGILSEKGGAVVMNVLGLEKVELEGFLQ